MAEEKNLTNSQAAQGSAPEPTRDEEQELEVPRDAFGVVRRLWKTSRREHWRFAVVLVCVLCYTVAQIAAPAYSAHVIDLLSTEI